MPPRCSFGEGFYFSDSSPRGATSSRSTLAEAAKGLPMPIAEPAFKSHPAPSTESPPPTDTPNTHTAPPPSEPPQPPPPRPAARGGYGGLAKQPSKGGGGYGKLGGVGGGGGGGGSSSSNPTPAPPKQYPKSANFERQITGLEVDDDDDERPQSARAAVRAAACSSRDSRRAGCPLPLLAEAPVPCAPSPPLSHAGALVVRIGRNARGDLQEATAELRLARQQVRADDCRRLPMAAVCSR